ncbi:MULTISPECIES: 50S ribosomal protein L3 [Psychrobacter]|jgi:large subunit ribosomal protein L3|uniref:Large ribosomal subunit protein uL3 n=1 Tax=Psychrobacter immobilis TaxID=498 RepID=A0A2V1ZZG9_PSYIM|nr:MULTISPECIES: 50S ribosomal protein L3 [Psychrobacter]MBE8609319.1 50S ribosomal protein L3 [Pseudomonas lundensis]KRG33931.1 50S ribosomal protein L3 [Psychrobacter sp. P11F6]MCG3809556.1 50S ribosomal protein L3 [Psychrobacter sp. Ps4]MCG3872442.1 50S ribosomal protein L3 [Psychrobacter sp. Ps7]PWK11155.1 LSU ribosomal protein L3P [Psychrobacter immobilis]
MAIGLVGKKCGMTRVFTEAGASIPVTVVEISANRITQVKNTDVDGYQAIQVTTGTRRDSRVAAAQKGHFAKAGVAAGRGVWEFRANDSDLEGREIGGEILADLFEQGQMVDVTGNSKGKGFQGGVKRHNFSMQDATHGNSVSHRAIGSTGQNQSPGKVFKGKKMPGQMGNKRVTVQGLEVISVDVEKGLLVIKGAIPGATGGDVIVRPSVKA